MMVISPEEKKNIDNDIKDIFKKLVNKMEVHHPYIKGLGCEEYTPVITSSLYVLISRNKLTLEDLRKEFTWFIDRLNIESVNYFDNEELKNEITVFKKCAVNINLKFDFESKARFTFNYEFNFFKVNMLSTTESEDLINLENQAIKLLGYDRRKWELQEMFSSITDFSNYQKREGSFKKFMTLEFLSFEEKWVEFLESKDKEIKNRYEKDLAELFEEVKKGEYGWLQLD